MAEGTLSDKPEDVAGEWHDAFKGLFNPTETETESEQCDDNFYDSISTQLKLTYESNIINAETPGLMNDAISKIEVARAINLAKTGKAQGVDMIPNEVLKKYYNEGISS